MVKTVFATSALAALSSIQAHEDPQPNLYQLTSDVSTSCTGIATWNTLQLSSQTSLIYFATGETECTAAVPSLTKVTDATQLACVIADEASTDAEAWKVDFGLNAACPMQYGAFGCTAKSVCQSNYPCHINSTDASKSYCPSVAKPTQGQFIEVTLSSNLPVFDNSLFTNAFSQAWDAATAVEPECFKDFVVDWAANGKMTFYKSLYELDATVCTSEKRSAFATAFDEELVSYNKDSANSTKVQIKLGMSLKNVVDYNDCYIDNRGASQVESYYCRGENAGCESIYCSYKEKCTVNSDCGTNKCSQVLEDGTAVENKVCISSSVAAVVGPIIAAVIAVTLF